jgi:tRNA pseudouridine38-40 synthase
MEYWHCRIDLGYDGTAFAGSQRQPGRRTVQGELEAALSQLTGEPIRVALAGRTDRGVHACGQVASAMVRWRHGPAALGRALNACLPEDLRVFEVRPVPSDFHARKSACYREYRYRLWVGARPPVLLQRYLWWVPDELNDRALEEATAYLPGERDLRAFTGKGMGIPGHPGRTVRQIYAARWQVLPTWERAHGSRVLEFRIAANGFLPHVVRTIVGALVCVGLGQQPPAWFAWLLAQADRRLAPPPAPPHGLVLWRVGYPDEPGITLLMQGQEIEDEDLRTENLYGEAWRSRA